MRQKDPENVDEFDLEAALGIEIRHPKTGAVVTNPAEKLAIIEGAYYFDHENKFKVRWGALVRERLIAHLPKTFGLTPEEAVLWGKVASDTLIRIHELRTLIPFSYGQLCMILLQARIPVYRMGSTNGELFVFHGDIVRLIETSRIDVDAERGLLGNWLLAWARGQEAQRAHLIRRGPNPVRRKQKNPKGKFARGYQPRPGRERAEDHGGDGEARPVSGGRAGPGNGGPETARTAPAAPAGTPGNGQPRQPTGDRNFPPGSAVGPRLPEGTGVRGRTARRRLERIVDARHRRFFDGRSTVATIPASAAAHGPTGFRAPAEVPDERKPRRRKPVRGTEPEK